MSGCFQHPRLIIIIDPIVPFSELRMLDRQLHVQPEYLQEYVAVIQYLHTEDNQILFLKRPILFHL
jgi:hypothetical protein